MSRKGNRGQRTAKRAAERRFKKSMPKVMGVVSREQVARTQRDPYGALLEKLTEDERALARRAEENAPPPEGLLPKTIRMLMPRDAEILLTWAQAAYARGAAHNPGRCWFDDYETPYFPLRAMAEGWVLGLSCVSADLDKACHITRQLGGPRAGVLRLPHETVMPVGTGRDDTGLGWILALNDDADGGLLYWPELKAVTRLRAGWAVLYPRTHTPGITRIDPAKGARFTVESHAPPRAIREVLVPDLRDPPPGDAAEAPGTGPQSRPAAPPADHPAQPPDPSPSAAPPSA